MCYNISKDFFLFKTCYERKTVMSNMNNRHARVNSLLNWQEKWNDVGKNTRYRNMSFHELSLARETTITLSVHHKDDGNVTRGRVSLHSDGHDLYDFDIDGILTMEEMKKQACAGCVEWLQDICSWSEQLIRIIDVLSKC